MNGKKAKMFRALAGVNKQNQEARSYHGVAHTVRNKTITNPMLLDAKGLPQITHRFTTATYALNQGAHLLNKMLKNKYKAARRNSTGIFA